MGKIRGLQVAVLTEQLLWKILSITQKFGYMCVLWSASPLGAILHKCTRNHTQEYTRISRVTLAEIFLATPNTHFHTFLVLNSCVHSQPEDHSWKGRDLVPSNGIWAEGVSVPSGQCSLRRWCVLSLSFSFFLLSRLLPWWLKLDQEMWIRKRNWDSRTKTMNHGNKGNLVSWECGAQYRPWTTYWRFYGEATLISVLIIDIFTSHFLSLSVELNSNYDSNLFQIRKIKIILFINSRTEIWLTFYQWNGLQ